MAVHSVGPVFFPLPWEMMGVLVSSLKGQCETRSPDEVFTDTGKQAGLPPGFIVIR